MPVANQQQIERHLPAEWQPDFSCAHGLIVQLAHELIVQEGKGRTPHFSVNNYF
jgi:hypothetical protein